MTRAEHCFQFDIDVAVDGADEWQVIRECDIDELCGVENHLTNFDLLVVIKEWSSVQPSQGVSEAMAGEVEIGMTNRY
jgi:hypothetical protein